MKMIVNRIERTNRQGTSKSGNPYHIDNTMVTVVIPFENSDGFGVKEMSYEFGTSQNFSTLDFCRGKLPMELDVELGTQLNQYGNPVTVITSIKPILLNKIEK